LKIYPGDIELVEKLHKGDITAFDLLYEKYSGLLYRFGFKYLKSEEEAKELVQSVYLKIWENHKELDRDLSFKSYLYTITYNDICKLFRKKAYLKRFIDEMSYSVPPSSSETEEKIEYQSVLNRIHQIVERLPERQKVIFLKSRDEGKTTKEIASELNLSPGTIDNYISESLKFIRRILHKEDLLVVIVFLNLLFKG
jgi:RNA polymerase sigma-70 factor (ECF subfamily)